MSAFSSPKAYVLYVEGRLGWSGLAGTTEQRRKFLIVETSKVKRRIATAPELYTWKNLQLAVDHMHREHLYGYGPMGAFAFVAEAVKADRRSREAKPTDLGKAVQDAIALEQDMQLDGHEHWIRRLVRSSGPARQEVLDEWATDRRPT